MKPGVRTVAVLVALVAGAAASPVLAGAFAVGPKVGPVPGGFRPVSFTAISDSDWWLLGSAPCKRAPCTSIVTTRDGGRSFVGLPAPRTGRVDQLRFADLHNGFAFGPELWRTHNGGETWKPVELGGNVEDLTAAGGWVYALLSTAHGSGRLLRSPAGRDAWRPVGKLVGEPFAGLWAQGSRVMVETQSRTGSSSRLLVSTDSGAHFRLAGSAPPAVECQLQGVLPVIWAACATGTESGVWRSSNGGARFIGVGGDANRSSGPSEPNSAAFGAATSTAAVYGYRQLWRTSDAGAHWRAVPGTRDALWWTYLGFTDATHGAALGEFQGGSRLYYTTDGGASYHRVPIPGAGALSVQPRSR